MSKLNICGQLEKIIKLLMLMLIRKVITIIILEMNLLVIVSGKLISIYRLDPRRIPI